MGRRQDCTKTTITQASNGHGFTHHVQAPFRGAYALDKTYTLDCYAQDYCIDAAQKYQFDMIYLDSTNNVFMTYYCTDLA